MGNKIDVLEEKTVYPTWISEFGLRIQTTVVNNPDGTVTVKDDNSPRQSTGKSLSEALDRLQGEIEKARLTGDF